MAYSVVIIINFTKCALKMTGTPMQLIAGQCSLAFLSVIAIKLNKCNVQTATDM